MTGRYDTHQAFRAALEQRLLTQARHTGRPLDRLRKEVAHQRFLARLAAATEPGTWVLKGGLGLLARLDASARATADADANWRCPAEDLDDALVTAASYDLNDGFAFQVSRPRPLQGETDDGALRYPVLALLAGREFERISVDINILPADQRPTEMIRLRNVLDFADIEPPQVPVIPIGQQLAEKLHAYTRTYGNGSSRPRDLYDMLVIAEQLPIPSAQQLLSACRETFELRDTSWPPTVNEPPQAWTAAWDEYVQVYRIQWTTLTDAGNALRNFWAPVLSSGASRATWSSDQWEWR